MSAQQSDVPEELLSPQPIAPKQRQVVRRATQLCRRAEPHTDETPCTAHMNEANRQLLGLQG
jgi:hypothetical protein